MVYFQTHKDRGKELEDVVETDPRSVRMTEEGLVERIKEDEEFRTMFEHLHAELQPVAAIHDEGEIKALRCVFQVHDEMIDHEEAMEQADRLDDLRDGWHGDVWFRSHGPKEKYTYTVNVGIARTLEE